MFYENSRYYFFNTCFCLRDELRLHFAHFSAFDRLYLNPRILLVWHILSNFQNTLGYQNLKKCVQPIIFGQLSENYFYFFVKNEPANFNFHKFKSEVNSSKIEKYGKTLAHRIWAPTIWVDLKSINFGILDLYQDYDAWLLILKNKNFSAKAFKSREKINQSKTLCRRKPGAKSYEEANIFHMMNFLLCYACSIVSDLENMFDN